MNIEKTKILIIFIAIFICLNILIWFLLSIVKGTLFVYLWDRKYGLPWHEVLDANLAFEK